jgi:hypothetical protein
MTSNSVCIDVSEEVKNKINQLKIRYNITIKAVIELAVINFYDANLELFVDRNTLSIIKNRLLEQGTTVRNWCLLNGFTPDELYKACKKMDEGYSYTAVDRAKKGDKIFKTRTQLVFNKIEEFLKEN